MYDTPGSPLEGPSGAPTRLAGDRCCYTATELPYRYFDSVAQKAIPYSKFYNTILLSSGYEKQGCANSNIIESLSRELIIPEPANDGFLELGLREVGIDGMGESEDMEDTDDEDEIYGADAYGIRLRSYNPKPDEFNPRDWDDFVAPEYRREEDIQEAEDPGSVEHPLRTKLKAYLSNLVQDESRNGDDILGFLHGLFFASRASGIHVCTSHNCSRMKSALEGLMPRCSSWVGFELWALQLAACICGQETDTDPLTDPAIEDSRLSILPAIISSMVRDYYGFYPTPYLYSWSRLSRLYSWPGITINDDYRDWADSVLLHEVYPVLSWLEAISTGSYKVPGGELPGGPLESWIFNGMGGLQDFSLCPHRVAGVAVSLPGKELNISALLPTRNIPVLEHSGHEGCSYTECKEGIIDSTSVKQLHDCVDPATCETTRGLFPQSTLINATRAGRPTAWSLDGLSLIGEGQPFMAISHVWADGTGVGSDKVVGVVNRCLWRFFCGIAIELGCEGIWWDTICVPADREIRRIALSTMHTNYASASVTLVHDLYLRNFKWVGAESACFAVVMSTWFTRGWTALELAQSGRVEVLFKSGSNGFVTKNLDNDILAKAREPSSPCHQVSTTAIRSLRRGDIMEKDEFLASFTPRYTSRSTDRLIIAGLLVGIEMPISTDQEEIYERIRKKLRIGRNPKSERELDDCLFFQLETPDPRTIDQLKNFREAEIRYLKRIRETPDLEQRDPWDLVWRPKWFRGYPKNYQGLCTQKDPATTLEYCWRVASCLCCRPHLPDVFPQSHVENAISALRNPHDLAYAESKPLCDHVTRWSQGDQPKWDEAHLRGLGFETPFWTSWCPPDWESLRSDILKENDWMKKQMSEAKRHRVGAKGYHFTPIDDSKPMFLGTL